MGRIKNPPHTQLKTGYANEIAMKILRSLILAAMLPGICLAQSSKLEKQAVELVKRAPVSTLEENMPRRPFADWLKEQVGAEAGIVWQLSECDQLGLAQPGADAPACVEANALLRDGRKVVVLVAVGTFKKGVTGDPGFYYAIIEQGDQLYSLNRLRDLPEGLRSPERLKEKAEIRLTANSQAGLASVITAPVKATSDGSVPPPPSTVGGVASKPEPTSAPRIEARKVSEGALVGAAVTKVSPVFPEAAKRVNAWGEVQVLVVISETGRVTDARAVSGHLLLRGAAVAAARRWVFTPSQLNGAPVSVQGVITFVFDRP